MGLQSLKGPASGNTSQSADKLTLSEVEERIDGIAKNHQENCRRWTEVAGKALKEFEAKLDKSPYDTRLKNLCNQELSQLHGQTQINPVQLPTSAAVKAHFLRGGDVDGMTQPRESASRLLLSYYLKISKIHSSAAVPYGVLQGTNGTAAAPLKEPVEAISQLAEEVSAHHREILGLPVLYHDYLSLLREESRPFKPLPPGPVGSTSSDAPTAYSPVPRRATPTHNKNSSSILYLGAALLLLSAIVLAGLAAGHHLRKQ